MQRGGENCPADFRGRSKLTDFLPHGSFQKGLNMKLIFPLRRLAWTAVVPCLLLLCSIREVQPVRAADAPRRIEVTAKRFEYIPGDITLKKGEPVVLVLHSVDVAHGVKFAELNLKADIGTAGTSELAFTPDKVGTFVGHCSHFCGSGHGTMVLTLHVTE
jgi:cytochrome c oxidase subunit 2